MNMQALTRRNLSGHPVEHLYAVVSGWQMLLQFPNASR